MLTEIRCDALDEEFRIIKFRRGLNIVLGTSDGSSALGKTMFLQLIEFCFGGDSYMAGNSDMRQHVSDHIVYYTFAWEGEEYYFYRDTSRLNYVCICDKDGNNIEEISIRKYKELLSQKYGLLSEKADIGACMDHFFRIYGKENVQERYPFLSRLKEKAEDALDFLLRMFEGDSIINDIHDMAATLGLNASEFKKTNSKAITTNDIKSIKMTIDALKSQLNKLMENKDDERLLLLGLNNSSVEGVAKLQKELRSLILKRNDFVAQRDAIIAGNDDFCSEVVEQDLEDLRYFFPEVNLKALDEIHLFHVRIREILANEAREETDKLQKNIDVCDKEILDLQRRLDESGYTEQMMKRILSQVTNIQNEIEKKQQELDKLLIAQSQQESIKEAERKMTDLIDQEWRLIRTMQVRINASMADYNIVVTKGYENPPSMGIADDKTIHFGTFGNTGESTAFKGLILYDLVMLKNTVLPALIHDSNIIRRINRIYLEKLFQLYETSKKQAFIVLDGTNDLSDAIKRIVEQAAVIRLSDDHKLFGKSWANIKNSEE